MIQTTLCYIRRGEDYLMLHRTKKEHDVNKDKWIGLGGKFEDGESPEDCVLREVHEETGLTLTHYQYRGILTFSCPPYPTEHIHLFTADGFTGTLTPCDEGELAWLHRDKLFDLPHWKGDEIFLKLLPQTVPFFSLKLSYQGDQLQAAVLNGKPMGPDPAGNWAVAEEPPG